MIKAIIFDCFGVLAEDGWTPFKQQFLADKPEQLKQVQGIGKQVDDGSRTFADMIVQTAHILDIAEDDVWQAVNRKVPNTQLFTYITRELQPTYKIGLLSNASYDIRSQLFTPEQASIFDASVLSYEVGLVKPDPRIYQAIAEKLGLDASECLLVDDQEQHCQGARAVGMQSVLFTGVPQLRQEVLALHD